VLANNYPATYLAVESVDASIVLLLGFLLTSTRLGPVWLANNNE
jgi:hypothetical protein